MTQFLMLAAPYVTALFGSLILGGVVSKATDNKADYIATCMGIYLITLALVFAVRLS